MRATFLSIVAASASILLGTSYPSMGDELTRSDRLALRTCAKAILSSAGDAAARARAVKVAGHEFSCKPAEISHRRNSTLVVRGQLSHMLRFREDDQVNYRIQIDRCSDEVRTMRVSYNRGGIAPIAGAVARLIGKNNFENEWRNAARDWDGNWEETAQLVIAFAGNNYKRYTSFEGGSVGGCTTVDSGRRDRKRSEGSRGERRDRDER